MEPLFNINLGRLAEMLPFGMRVKTVLRLLRAGFAPYANHLSQAFNTARAGDHFRLRHNGQVCYLCAALNSTFKSSLNGVCFRIGDKTLERKWIYAWQEAHPGILHLNALAELKPRLTAIIQPNGSLLNKLIYPPFDPAYAPSEVHSNDLCNFIVYVPSDLYRACLPQIKQLVDQYRLVSRVPQYEPINS